MHSANPSVQKALSSCDQQIYLNLYGIITAVHCAESDREHLAFTYRDFLAPHPLIGADVQVWLWSSGGFYRSLFAQDGTPKIAVMRERGHPVRESAFRYWPGEPSFVPPFTSNAFRAGGLLIPGEVITSPDGAAVLITGEVHIGKTRLTLEMFERGWSAFSDHLAVFNKDTGCAWPGGGIAGLRRHTLAAYREQLHELPTRTTRSAVTGDVVLVRVRDLFPSMAPAQKSVRLTHWVNLQSDSGEIGPRSPIDPGTLPIYPAYTRTHIDAVLPVQRGTLAVDTSTSMTPVADVLDTWVHTRAGER